ncbi:MAG: DUF5615 family PIN-like protein [Planctomycetota bacterium]
MDENLPRTFSDWIVELGFDVVHGGESMPGADDDAVAAFCEEEQRVLLTEDLGFGERVVRGGFRPAGVILLRLDKLAAADKLARVIERWPEVQPRLSTQLVTIGESSVRFRPQTKSDPS